MMPVRPRLGQHFLSDRSALERIAAASARPGDTVIEIGPGRGALTRPLLRRARSVIAVELDEGLAAELSGRCGHPRNLEVVRGDILDLDLGRILKDRDPSRSVMAGNLPYYVTSPILRSALASARLIRSATFLVQEEVADRIVAKPGSRSFGYLSCLCQLHSKPAKLFSLGPAAFSPPPKVRSAAIRLAMRQGSPPEGLLSFLRACFRSPRKTLRNNLAGRYSRSCLAADRCSGLRAQQLGLAELAAMWERLEAQDARTPTPTRSGHIRC